MASNDSIRSTRRNSPRTRVDRDKEEEETERTRTTCSTAHLSHDEDTTHDPVRVVAMETTPSSSSRCKREIVISLRPIETEDLTKYGVLHRGCRRLCLDDVQSETSRGHYNHNEFDSTHGKPLDGSVEGRAIDECKQQQLTNLNRSMADINLSSAIPLLSSTALSGHVTITTDTGVTEAVTIDTEAADAVTIDTEASDAVTLDTDGSNVIGVNRHRSTLSRGRKRRSIPLQQAPIPCVNLCQQILTDLPDQDRLEQLVHLAFNHAVSVVEKEYPDSPTVISELKCIDISPAIEVMSSIIRQPFYSTNETNPLNNSMETSVKQYQSQITALDKQVAKWKALEHEMKKRLDNSDVLLKNASSSWKQKRCPPPGMTDRDREMLNGRLDLTKIRKELQESRELVHLQVDVLSQFIQCETELANVYQQRLDGIQQSVDKKIKIAEHLPETPRTTIRLFQSDNSITSSSCP